MTAAVSSSLGSAPAALRPPAGAPQAGAPTSTGDAPRVTPAVQSPDRVCGGPAGGGFSAVELADLVGCSYRQIDYWIRVGAFAPRNRNLGYGRRRRFDDIDVEVASALTTLAALGGHQHLKLAASAVMETPVRPGEWPLVTIAGHALRCSAADLPRVVHRDGAAHAAWLIPLQAFDQGRPQ